MCYDFSVSMCKLLSCTEPFIRQIQFMTSTIIIRAWSQGIQMRQGNNLSGVVLHLLTTTVVGLQEHTSKSIYLLYVCGFRKHRIKIHSKGHRMFPFTMFIHFCHFLFQFCKYCFAKLDVVKHPEVSWNLSLLQSIHLVLGHFILKKIPMCHLAIL